MPPGALLNPCPTIRAVIDAIREVRPPFSPEGVVNDFAMLLKSYRVTRVSMRSGVRASCAAARQPTKDTQGREELW
jgi:hypothetical protein